MKHSFKNSLIVILTLTSLIINAVGVTPALAVSNTIYVANLQPDWNAVDGGGVWSSYDGPPDYAFVSPGSTALIDGREAGIIKAGLAPDPDTGVYQDEGIFGFKPTGTIDEFAAGTLTYDVENEEGTNPVWMTIEIDTGAVDDRSDNTTYQFVPTTNPDGWNTFDAGAGQWQKWNDNNGDTTGNPLIPLSDIVTAHTGLNVVRAYLRLGMGDSYHGSGSGTIAWVDKVNLGGKTYDFVVTIPDTTAPVVTVPSDMLVEATDVNGAAVTFDATATDDVDGPLPVSCDPASGATFAFGDTTVNCTASDSAGNTGSASFKVTVRDTTAPVINVPPDITEEATDANGAVVTFNVTASDAIDGEMSASCDPASGATFAFGETTVNCTATDAANNTGNGSFKITVSDTTAPVVAVPGDIIAEADDANGAAVDFVVTASDAVDGALTPSCDYNSGDVFPFGETTVTCEATDAANNNGSASFKITVADTTLPVVTVPTDITEDAVDENGAPVSFDVTASDNIDGDLSVSCDYNSGDVFPLGETTVTCTATDSHNNQGSASFKITVGSPAVSLDNASWDFGDVVLGQNSTQTFTITNSGTADLNIGTLSITGAGFSLDNNSCSNAAVLASESCTFDVIFAAEGVALMSGTVSIPSDAFSSPDTVSLSANGIPVVAGEGKYDDIDPLWIYSSGWTAMSAAKAHDGTIHRTNVKNSTATFSFQAPAFFTVSYRTGTNRGSFEIRVDGALLKTINAYSTTAVWQKQYTSPAYADDQVHTVVIKNVAPIGTYVDVDAVELTTAPAPAGAGMYDDIDPLWIYSDGWTAIPASGAHDGTIHRTNVNGSTATFVFQAPAQFAFYYRKGPSRGTFTVWVDGAKIATVDAYSATTKWLKLYTSPVYSDDHVHTVVIKNSSPDGTYIDVDAIEIK